MEVRRLLATALSAETWGLLERALEGARRRSLVDDAGPAKPPTAADDSITTQGGSSSHGATARLLHAIGGAVWGSGCIR